MPVPTDDTKLAITHQSFPYGAMTEKFIALLWGLSPLLKLQKRHGLLLTHTRGSAPNSGRFPGFRQTRDVQEWVAWLQRQPWYNGVLFSTGLSAMGVMSYLSAMVWSASCPSSPPPSLSPSRNARLDLGVAV